MVAEQKEYNVTESWKGFKKGVSIKIVEIYPFEDSEFVAFKNDSTNMETEVEKGKVEKAVENGVLKELDEPRKIQI